MENPGPEGAREIDISLQPWGWVRGWLLEGDGIRPDIHSMEEEGLGKSPWKEERHRVQQPKDSRKFGEHWIGTKRAQGRLKILRGDQRRVAEARLCVLGEGDGFRVCEPSVVVRATSEVEARESGSPWAAWAFVRASVKKN